MASIRQRQPPSVATTMVSQTGTPNGAAQAGSSSPTRLFRDPNSAMGSVSGSTSPSRQTMNIMYDPRVVRGSMYTPQPPQTQPASATNNLLRRKPIAPIATSPSSKDVSSKTNSANKEHTHIPPVSGRQHADIQTDLYLEEILDAVPEAHISTQTDQFYDRPASPLFVPKKSGEDVHTQIEDGELFDFDYEVAPIVEVLLGKVLEQAIMEVAEEQELENLRKHQKLYESKRNAELAETQRMEDAERRRTEEKDRRLKESAALLAQKKETAAKIASRAFTTSYLSTLIPTVLSDLTDVGYFHDRVTREVEMDMLPWISDNVVAELKKSELASKMVDDLLLSAMRLRDDGEED